MSVPAGPEVLMQIPMLPAWHGCIPPPYEMHPQRAGEDVLDPAMVTHCCIERVDRRTREAEGLRGTFEPRIFTAASAARIRGMSVLRH